jgi:hypothetical protein
MHVDVVPGSFISLRRVRLRQVALSHLDILVPEAVAVRDRQRRRRHTSISGSALSDRSNLSLGDQNW